MKKILTSALLISMIVVSCKKEETAPTETSNKEVSVFSDSFSGPTDTVPPPPPSEVQNIQPMPGQTATTTAQPVATAKGMNPAHGQPGHRCDIAVGAPLNSPAGKGSPTQAAPITKTTTISSNGAQNGVVSSNGATITTTNNASQTTVSPVVTAPGMNPPHGQEGHDCAVAVGAPLPKKE